MKSSTLYPLLGLCVLLLAACGAKQGQEEVAPQEAGAPEATHPDPAPSPGETPMLRVVVLGNSLAAGYGLDPEQAFPALLQQKVDSLGWPITVVNAGVSGETSAGGLRRIDWLLRDRIDVLVLELGGNDGLRGIPAEVTKANLQGIIKATRERYPDARIVLAGMQIPTNLGQTYTEHFRRIYPELARESDAALIPFLLQDVGGISTLNQPDGIHPTAEGHRIVAATVWTTLQPVLTSLLQNT